MMDASLLLLDKSLQLCPLAHNSLASCHRGEHKRRMNQVHHVTFDPPATRLSELVNSKLIGRGRGQLFSK